MSDILNNYYQRAREAASLHKERVVLREEMPAVLKYLQKELAKKLAEKKLSSDVRSQLELEHRVCGEVLELINKDLWHF